MKLHPPSPTTQTRLALALGYLIALIGPPIRADQPPARPADALIDLVPADSAVVLSVEGLREHWGSPAVTRLVADIRGLPFVREWMNSETVQHWEQSRDQIERFLGLSLTQLRDDILGDAFVLALRLEDGAPAAGGQPRGLLLVKPRDPDQLTRLIDLFNRTQQENGELARVDDRNRGEITYHVREFAPNSGRPAEYYTTAPGGIFALSNSESLIQSVIQTTQAANPKVPVPTGLAASPQFQTVQQKLPPVALARLFVDPRTIEKFLFAGHDSVKTHEVQVAALLERQLAAVEYAGAAVTIDDDMASIRLVETLNPTKLDAPIQRWAAPHPASPAVQPRVPASAVGILSLSIDFPALHELITRLIPERERPRWNNMQTILTGLFLGQDLATRILPALGPRVLAYLDSPVEESKTVSNSPRPADTQDWLFPLVMIIDLGSSSTSKPAEPGIATSIENALQTLLALLALDEKRAQGLSRIREQQTASVRVMTLEPPIPFAFALDRGHHRLVLATSAAAATRYLESAQSSDKGPGIDRFKPKPLAAFDTFAAIDLQALDRVIIRHRPRVVAHLASRDHRAPGDVSRDLEHLLQICRLSPSLFIASRFEPDASAAHQWIGLALRAAPLKQQ